MSEHHKTYLADIEPASDEDRYDPKDYAPEEDPFGIEDNEEPSSEVNQTTLDLSTIDLFDASIPQPLFSGVKVYENGSFLVPKRYLRTQEYGVWSFEAYGYRRWFKERDDYGEFRSLQSGDEIWVPHLYPFEETDAKGIPIIRDRERCQLTIVLEPVNGAECDNYLITEVTVGSQLYGAAQSPESLTSFQTDFTEFMAVGNALNAEKVERPERRWQFLRDYLEEAGRLRDYDDITRGNILMPDEYTSQNRPFDWQTRTPSTLIGTAFGQIWIPVEELRKGLEASILFPMFGAEHEILG